MSDSLASHVASFFIDNLPGLGLSSRGHFMVGSVILRSTRGGLFQKLKERLPPEALKILYSQFALSLADIEAPAFEFPLETVLRSLLSRPLNEDPTCDPGELRFNDSITSPLDKLKIIVNVKNRRKSVIYDTATDEIFEYDYDLIQMKLKFLLGDEKDRWIASHSEECNFVYRPDLRHRITRMKGEEGHKIFNTWTDAEWRKTWDSKIVVSELPTEIDKYLRALVVTDEDRRSMLAWLRDAAFGRANPILILCGVPGGGKNSFVEVAKALVGPTNYREASRGFKNSAFHNNVSHCRLFFLDETNLTPDARDTLKAYHNGTAAIERKGVDVGDPEPIYASFVIANNFKENIRLEYTDRKFFAPMLSKTPLLEQIPKEEVDHLFQVLLQDPAYVSRLASYLFHKFKSKESERFSRGEFFKELCIQSYPYQFRRFIMTCEVQKEFTHRVFNKGARHPIEPLELKKFIEHYEKTFRRPLAEFEFKPGENSWRAVSKVAVENAGSVAGQEEDDEDFGAAAVTSSARLAANDFGEGLLL